MLRQLHRPRTVICAILIAAALGPCVAVAAASGGGGSGGGGLTGATTTGTGATDTTGTATTGTGTGTSTTGTTTTGTSTIGTTTTGASTGTTTTTTTTTTGTTGTSTTTTPAPAPPVTAVPANNPFARRAMWIWELPATSGGSVAKIIARARRYGVRTLLIKSGDGSGYWSQFSRSLVVRLHRAGMKVCAWQYIYGYQPAAEAAVGYDAVAKGADCLVIDAETSYEGRYVAAQTYMTDLRARVGANFPVALASFPYVDYHPKFPYSVFLGPGGAQYNVPQMYWRDIGVSTTTVFAHTYEWNEIYKRPIYPLGQLYNSPPVVQIRQFNRLATLYGARGVSWWDWQEASNSEFAALSQWVRLGPSFSPTTAAITLSQGAAGDYVYWAQELLSSWAATNLIGTLAAVTLNGRYNSTFAAQIGDFQSTEGLPVTGMIDGYTWNKLLTLTPVPVTWSGSGKTLTAKRRAQTAKRKTLTAKRRTTARRAN